MGTAVAGDEGGLGQYPSRKSNVLSRAFLGVFSGAVTDVDVEVRGLEGKAGFTNGVSEVVRFGWVGLDTASRSSLSVSSVSAILFLSNFLFAKWVNEEDEPLGKAACFGSPR